MQDKIYYIRKDRIKLTAKGWIIYNGNLPGNKFLDFAQMLQQAAAKFNSEAEIYKNNELVSLLTSNTLSILSKQHFPDYVVFTDKDIYLARQLELLGIPVFNSAKAIETSDDKIATYQQLAFQKLPIPETIIAPKIFTEGNLDQAVTDAIMERLGLPLIIKEAFGSFGEQVYLIHTEAEMVEKIDQLQGRPFLFQQFVTESSGVDLRLQVVGDEVVASMKRQSNDDFRANVTSGGFMNPYTPSEKEKELAIRAAKAIGTDFAGVDLLLGKGGRRYICEVNSNAHIRNLLDCTNINAADYIMKYILQKINNE